MTIHKAENCCIIILLLTQLLRQHVILKLYFKQWWRYGWACRALVHPVLCLAHPFLAHPVLRLANPVFILITQSFYVWPA